MAAFVQVAQVEHLAFGFFIQNKIKRKKSKKIEKKG